MKKLVFAISLLVSLSLASSVYQPHHNLFESSTFNNHADAWVKAYLFNNYGGRTATDIELQYVANLMYFSYLRSFETVRVQETALAMLEGAWYGWQNIAKRRLNPGNTPQYTVNIEAEKQRAQDFWDQYDLHQRMSSAYDITTKQVVHGTLLETPVVKKGVDDMRKEARKIMLDALADVKQYLGKAFDYAFRPTFKNDKEITRGIGDFVMSYIPQLAVGTFIHADKLHNTVSDDTWNILHGVQKVGIQTWYAIEKARMAFYKAHYAKVYRSMQELRINTPYFAYAFNEHGIIAASEQSVLLPDPSTLP